MNGFIEEIGKAREEGGEPPGSSTFGGGSGFLGARPWRDFDFSRIASGPLYFYVGAGLSMGAGLAGWGEMACLIWLYRKNFEGVEKPGCPTDTARNIEKFLDDFIREKIKKGDKQTPRILSRKTGKHLEEERAFGRTALLNMLLRYRGPRVFLEPEGGKPVADPEKQPRLRPGKEPRKKDLMVQSLIWRSRCHGVFTTNYDMLLENAFSLYHHGGALRSYRYTANFLCFILSNPHFVLKLHGDINDIATMELCPRKAWSSKGKLTEKKDGRGQDLKDAYAAALDGGHMIYLGCGFRDETIRQLHGNWQPKVESLLLTRIALLPEWELEKPATKPEIELISKKGIELLSFSNFAEVREIMEEVASVRSGAQGHWASCPEASDLHQQLFLGWNPLAAKRHFSTEPWSCKGMVLPRELAGSSQ